MQATKNYVLRKIVDESILVPISPSLKHRDCLFVLNPTARAIYEGFRARLSDDEIVERVLEEFDGVEESALRSDVSRLAQQLVEIEALDASAQG